MPFRAFVRALLLGALGVILLAFPVMASGGHDFAGTYGLANVQEQGDMVQLTLHVRLINNSEVDIKGAAVVLMEGPTGVSMRGGFPLVKVWRKHQDVKLTQQFTVPKSEYQDWLRPPAQPNVVVIYQDANGRTWQKGAQMRPQPVI